MKKYISFFLLVLIIVFSLNLVSAHTNDIDSGVYDSTSKFKLLGDTLHLGATSSTYYFSPWELYDTYYANMSAASSAWGAYLSVSFDDESDNYVWRTTSSSSIMAAATTPSYSHDNEWNLLIYSDNFDSISSTQKKYVLAHELGHAWGLSHVMYTTSIMYPYYQSPMPAPTTQDINGIRNCNHTHTTHSFTIFDDYGSTIYHKTRCSSCFGYYLEPHNMVEGECIECGYIQ